MEKIEVYCGLWEYLRQHGLKTIHVIKNAGAWEYRVAAREYSVKETFHHTLQAIFEDAGNWFLNDPRRFAPSGNPIEDLNQAINRMIHAIKGLCDEDLNESFTFQWGEQTTIEGAIQQNLFHAVGHFGQLRNWVGLYRRSREENAEKTNL